MTKTDSQPTLKQMTDAATLQGKMSSDLAYVVKAVDTLNQKMDALPNSYVSIKEFNELEKQVSSHSDKISSLQRFQWTASGALALLSFIAPLIVYYFLR